MQQVGYDYDLAVTAGAYTVTVNNYSGTTLATLAYDVAANPSGASPTIRLNAIAADYMDCVIAGNTSLYRNDAAVAVTVAGTTAYFYPGRGILNVSADGGATSGWQSRRLATGQTELVHPAHLPFVGMSMGSDPIALLFNKGETTPSNRIVDGSEIYLPFTSLTSYAGGRIYVYYADGSGSYVPITDEYCEADGIVYRNWLGGYQLLPCLGRTTFGEKVSRETMTVAATSAYQTRPERAKTDWRIQLTRQATLRTGPVKALAGSVWGAQVPVDGVAVAEIVSSPDVYVMFHDQTTYLYPCVVTDSTMTWQDRRAGICKYDIKVELATAPIDLLI